MAQMSVKSFVKQNGIGKTLDAAYKMATDGSRVIMGHLQVLKGHDYWWFLEYGTGNFFGEKGAPDGTLREPPSISGESPEGGDYDITAKNVRLLVYVTHGHVMRREATVHPGLSPLGFVRTSRFEAEKELKADLRRELQRRAKTNRPFPTRREMVRIVNDVLDGLVRRLQIRTPDDQDAIPGSENYNPRHTHRPHTPPLADSWRVTKAK